MTSEAKAAPERYLRWLPVALAALAVAVRLPNLGWGLPGFEEEAFPLKKAFEMWGWAEGGVRLDPETAGWPSLSFYVHLLLQKLQYLAGRMTGAFADRHDFYLLQLDMTPLVVAARSLGVAASAAVVLLGARLGGRIAGLTGALATGGLLALSPLLVRHAHLITPDILLAACAAAAFHHCVAVAEAGRRRDHLLAGLWIGLGISCKYTPVLLVPVLIAAHGLRRRSAGQAGPSARDLLGALAVAALAFALTSPYLLLDMDTLVRDFRLQQEHLGAGHLGQDNGPAWRFYLLHALGPGVGWPALILAAAGLVWAAVRRRPAGILALLTVVLFVGGLGLLSTRFDRYMLPALLPLALGPALLWREAAVASFLGRPAARTAAAALLLAACLVPPAARTVEYHRFRALPSTLDRAGEYITTVLGDGRYLAMESYCPDLPRDDADALRADPVFDRLTPAQQQRWLDRPFYRVVYLPLQTSRPELAAFYYDLRHLLAYEYVVTSGAVRERYQSDPDRFPRRVRFYADLDRHARLVRSFKAAPDVRGPEIRIYELNDETRRSLLAARGPLPADFFRPYLDRVSPSQFRGFATLVARHATSRRDDALSERFVTALYESLPPAERSSVLPQLAEARVRTGQWASARDLLREVVRRQPGNALAVGYLGQCLWELGERAEGRRLAARCLDMASADPAGREVAQWAQRLLDGMRDE